MHDANKEVTKGKEATPISYIPVSIPDTAPVLSTSRPPESSNTATPLPSAPRSTSLDLRYMTPSSASTAPPPAPRSYPEAHRAAPRVAHHSRSMSNMKPFQPPTPQNLSKMREEIEKKPKRSPTQYQTSRPIAPGLSLDTLFSEPDILLDRVDREISEEKGKPNGDPDVVKNLQELHGLITERQKLKKELIGSRAVAATGKGAITGTPEGQRAVSKKLGDRLNPQISSVEEKAIGVMETLSAHTSWLTMCQDLIIEHAVRRVEHFLYILVAYYNTSAHPMQQYPKLQHGQGRNDSKGKKFTDGAHSSLFSQFVDLTCVESPANLTYGGRKKAVTRQSLLCGTHYLDAINGVIELPYIVNLMVDKRLEGGITEATQSEYRKEALLIIQEVANGRYDPVEGLKRYLDLMKRAFAEIRTAIGREKDLNKRAMGLRALKLEEIGTFKTDITHNIDKLINEKGEISREYLNMLLGRDPQNRARLAELEETIRLAEAERTLLLEKGMLKTKEDILSNKSASIALGADQNDPFLLEDGHSPTRRPPRFALDPSSSSSSSSAGAVTQPPPQPLGNFFTAPPRTPGSGSDTSYGTFFGHPNQEESQPGQSEVRIDIQPAPTQLTSPKTGGHSPHLLGSSGHKKAQESSPLLPNPADSTQNPDDNDKKNGCCPSWCSVM